MTFFVLQVGQQQNAAAGGYGQAVAGYSSYDQSYQQGAQGQAAQGQYGQQSQTGQYMVHNEA